MALQQCLLMELPASNFACPMFFPSPALIPWDEASGNKHCV